MIINNTKNRQELNLIKKWLIEGHKTIKFKKFKPITISNFEIVSKTNGDTLFMDNHKELLLFNDWLNPDFALYNPSLTYSLQKMYDAYQTTENNKIQNNIDLFIQKIASNSMSVTSQYICNCIEGEKNPLRKIDKMLSDNRYPAFLQESFNNDRKFINEYILSDIKHNEDVDIPCKQFDYLTPYEQEIVCQMYFDSELVFIRTHLEHSLRKIGLDMYN